MLGLAFSVTRILVRIYEFELGNKSVVMDTTDSNTKSLQIDVLPIRKRVIQAFSYYVLKSTNVEKLVASLAFSSLNRVIRNLWGSGKL